MKKFILLCLLIFILNIKSKSQEVQNLTDYIDSASYSLGISLAANFLVNFQYVTLNKELLLEGFKRVIYNEKITELTGNKVQSLSEEFIAMASDLLKVKMDSISKQTKKIEKDFFEKNKKKSNIIETKSGLQYEVLTKGSGIKPTKDLLIKAHYKASLINEKVFQSSYDNNTPFLLDRDQKDIIPGLIELLDYMSIGDKFKAYIPSKLAFGEKGVGDVIPQNSPLIFEIEVIGFELKK